MDPWATGAWTFAPDTAPPAGTTVPPSAPDPVLSALADPEAWLASALADLDRIWGRRSDGTARVEDGPDAPEADEQPSGCVVVLDLARAGDRLPTDDAAPTVRRVARRLAQRLPESAHLRRDSPDTLSVLLADDDRAAAAEWMHRVVPALVDGLAVDAVVEGAHLRAAVHDAQGVVGAQVLQRLDGGRSRSPQGAPSGRARHAAAGAATSDDGACDGPEPGGPPAGRSPGSAAGGSATGGAARRAETRGNDSGTRPTADPGPPTGWATNGWPATAPDPSAQDTTGRDVPPAGRSPEPPAPAWGADGPGRHEEAGWRRPYLPDGVVVRPGTGGRRHRRGPDPVPEESTQEATPVGPQSTEGLGLADLLAGALAAYRGI